MILYTPLSETDIFPTSDKDFQKRHCMSHNGRQVYVEETQDGQYQLLQLLSTDPQDFMNPDYIPGTMMK